MFCYHCGAKLDDGTEICPACGEKLSFKTEEAHAPVEEVKEQPAAEVKEQPAAVVKEQPVAVVNEQPVAENSAPVSDIIKTTAKKLKKLSPISAVAVTFAVIALFFGFVITTCALAKERAIAYVEYIGIIPAMVALGTGVYSSVKSEDKLNKICSIASALFSLLILFYEFIGFCIFIC